jgi:hypothetical protein
MVNPSASPDPPLGCPDPPRGWLQFCVRFVFGVVFGAVTGSLMWLYLFPADAWGWLPLPLAVWFLHLLSRSTAIQSSYICVAFSHGCRGDVYREATSTI